MNGEPSLTADRANLVVGPNRRECAWESAAARDYAHQRVERHENWRECCYEVVEGDENLAKSMEASRIWVKKENDVLQ